MPHSGSRGIGNAIGSYFIELARRDMERQDALLPDRDLAEQTAGVMCRKDSGVLDEIPAAYKDIDAVMRHQTDLVEVVHTLKQVMCVKG